MPIGGVVINWMSKTRDAVADTDRLTRSIQGVNGAAKKAGGGLGSVIGGIGKAIPYVGAAVVGAAAGFTVMAKSAYDDAKAQAKLERNLRKTAGVTRKAAAETSAWIDQMELATLVADDDLRTALSKLTAVTGDLSDAQKLAKLSQDAAVGSGKEFSAVATAMAKAAGGNTQALKRMFPELDAGKDGVLSMAEAMEQLTDKYGGAAKAVADQDVFGRISVAFGQIGEAIGGAALPLLEDLSDWFSDKKNISKIEEWIGKLQTWATEIGTNVAGKLQDFIDWVKSPEGKKAMEDFTNNVKAIAGAIDTLVRSIKSLVEWWERLPNLDPDTWVKGGFNLGGTTANSPTLNSIGAGQLTGNEATRRPGVSITINNPKPEKASTSVAAGLRVSRPPTGYTGGGAW